MPQSLGRVYLHLIFSTKGRAPLLDDAIRPSLHSYMAVVLRNVDCPVELINSVSDHVHILFELGRTLTYSQAVEEVKKTSSKWIKTQNPQYRSFAWQAGYGAFSVSASRVGKVREYIANQQVHHRQRSFQDEFRRFLKRHCIAYDERYVWD